MPGEHFGGGFDGHPPTYMGGGEGFAHLLFFGVTMLLLWGLPLGLAWWALHRPARQPVIEPQPTAVELLRQRYATGQIDLVTFEQMVEHVIASENAEWRALAHRPAQPQTLEPIHPIQPIQPMRPANERIEPLTPPTGYEYTNYELL